MNIFQPIKDVKVYQQVINQIKDMIKSGELQRGDKLPSERELVQQLQVSRTSIREALSALQIIGLVESRHGEGNFVRERMDNNFLEPLSILFLLDKTPAWEILQCRLMLEVNSARLAAENASPEQIEEIRTVVGKLELYQQDEDQNIHWDKAFHYTIARATGNRLLFNVINSISGLVDFSIKDSQAKILMDPENQSILIEQHRCIFSAIAHGDGEEAAERMRTHLEYVNLCFEKEECRRERHEN